LTLRRARRPEHFPHPNQYRTPALAGGAREIYFASGEMNLAVLILFIQ
jgi:hypothetical protein